MRLHWLAVSVFVALTACGERGEDADSAAGAGSDDPAAGIELWDEEGRAQARAIYERACAACHDPGAGDAPSIGVREDWDGRSRMWVAVLTEHARLGYLEMPAKGGDPGLTDEQVAAASEYIMAMTYPELPLD